jgi:hypothetical protein
MISPTRFSAPWLPSARGLMRHEPFLGRNAQLRSCLEPVGHAAMRLPTTEGEPTYKHGV